MSEFAANPVLGHITTFGGHPVIAAAAVAGIEELTSHNWINEVEEKEKLFRELLIHPAIKNISGKGLMLALEFENVEFNAKLIQACLADGLITDWFLFAPNWLRVAPPLIITPVQIRWTCEILLKNILNLQG